jgi:phosphohistidine phosphatase SixA
VPQYRGWNDRLEQIIVTSIGINVIDGVRNNNQSRGAPAMSCNAFGPLIALAVLLSVASTAAQGQTETLPVAAEPATHILLRHAIAPGTGDPTGFMLDDCSTQRNLSNEGREQAVRIGRQLRKAGVSVDVVLSSQWCRSRETAELLGLGPVVAEPALNSFFDGQGDRDAQTRVLRARIAALDATGRKAALVSHQVNITALTGVYPASGEVVVIGRASDGAIVVRGRIRID